MDALRLRTDLKRARALLLHGDFHLAPVARVAKGSNPV